MKLHLPTALRRALLAITALLSPAVVTTTIATATLAAITAPTMADDLTLNGTYEFSGSVSFDSVTTGSPNDAIKATDRNASFTAGIVTIGTGHALDITSYQAGRIMNFYAGKIYTEQDSSITITANYSELYATETLYDLFKNMADKTLIIRGNSSSKVDVTGAGHDALKTSDVVRKIDFVNNAGPENPSVGCRLFITEGNLTIDSDLNVTPGLIYQLNIGNGTEGTATATITNQVTEFTTYTTINSDAELLISSADSALKIDAINVYGELVSDRDLILKGEAYFESEAGVTLNGHTTIVDECTVENTTLTTKRGITIKEGAQLTLSYTEFNSQHNLNLGGVIVNNGTLAFSNTGVHINITSSSFEAEHIKRLYSDGVNGYLESTAYTVVKGNGTVENAYSVNWSVDGREFPVNNHHYTDGVLTVTSSDTSEYRVASGTVNYGTDVTELATEDTKFSLEGGSLVLGKDFEGNQGIVAKDAGSSVEIGNGVTLNAAQLDASAADVTLSGSGSYDMQGQELSGVVELNTGVALDETDWKGTVYTGSVAQGAALDIRALGNSQSTVYLGAQPMRRAMPGETVLESLTAAGVGTTETPGSLTLQKGTSTADALVVNGILTLGSADAAAGLVADSVSLQGLSFAHADSSLVAGSLEGATTLNVQLTDEVLSNKDAGETLTLVTLQDGYDGTLTFNGSTETERVRSEDNRKEYTLAWNEAGTALTLTILGTETYVAEQVKPTTHNGRAGVALMTDVFLNSRPQKDAPDGALAGILNAVDAGTATDRDMAAVAGASTAALGMALSGDVERQLRAIRNRSLAGNDASTTTLVDEKSGMVSAEAPARFFAWVNAEGNRAEQNDDSTAAGYTLTSWGGTLGAGMQVNDQLTLGLALTAMYGDLQSDGPDYLKGDMDTTYVSAFARYNRGKWSHAFIGTAGTMEADYKRNAMSYSTDGDTDGTAFGLMYEVSREFELGNLSTLSPVLNIAYRHTEVDSYSESGADAALNVGKQSMDTVTLGAGARYAAVVGQQTLNRACGFEARALVKYDLGDRQSTTSTGFTGYATRAGIESTEQGAFGVELGAGISVPVGSGSIFADGAVELRSDYTNFNATVGYRIQF